MASLTDSSSDLTANFIATSFCASIPKDNRTSTLTLPMYTPDNKHVCDLELLATTSVPCNERKKHDYTLTIKTNSIVFSIPGPHNGVHKKQMEELFSIA